MPVDTADPGPSTPDAATTEEPSSSTPDAAITEVPTCESPSTCESCLKLKRKLKRLQNKLYRVKKKAVVGDKKKRSHVTRTAKQKMVLSYLKDLLPERSINFITTQIREVEKKARGRRWKEHDLQIALSLFHSSPKAYRLLKKVFLLPSVATLRRIMRKISVYPGINHKVINALKAKVSNMPQNSNVCALIFDEMSLREEVVYNKERDEVEGLEDLGKGQSFHQSLQRSTLFTALSKRG